MESKGDTVTTTTQEFIKKLRAFSIPLTGVPNFVEAEYLMKESADALEAAQAEIKVQTRAADHWMAEANKSHNLTVTQQAEIERLNGYVQKANMDVTAACVERDKALARLAITEEANSMLLARNKWLEHTLEAAGASPACVSNLVQSDEQTTLPATDDTQGASPVEPVPAIKPDTSVLQAAQWPPVGDTQPSQAQPEPSDLRGIDAGPVAEWVDLVKRGYVSRDECLIAVKDIPLWIAKNSEQAQPEPVNQVLLKALSAMLTHSGMDEDEWSKPTFDQARAAIMLATTKTQECGMCGYVGTKTDAVGQCPRCHWDELQAQPSQAGELSADDVRAAGGIVHSDGNIFFTNIGKLNAAINAKVAEAKLAQPSQADAQDAARYRWLRSTTNWASNSSNERIDVRNSPELWDAAIDAAINAKQPSQALELSQQEAEALAHRRASKYAHRSDSSYVAYTFLPHTLMDFVRAIIAAINAKGQPNG